MKRIIGFLLVSTVVATMLTSCNVTTDNPLDMPEEAQVDPTPYLGEWHLYEIGKETPEELVTVTLEKAGTEIKVIYTDGEPSVTETARLTKVNKDVIASLQDENGLWNIFRVSLNKNRNKMTLWQIDVDRLKIDIEDGVIEGEVTERDDGDLVHITASGEEIRSYLSGKKKHFFSTKGVILASAITPVPGRLASFEIKKLKIDWKKEGRKPKMDRIKIDGRLESALACRAD